MPRLPLRSARVPVHAALLALLALQLGVAPVRADTPAKPDSTKGVTPADVRAHPPVPRLFSRKDLLFLAGTTAAVTVAVFNDRWLTDKAVSASNNRFQKRLAEAAQPLGNPMYVLPAAGIVYGFGRVVNHPKLERRAVRVALAVGVSGVLSTAIKEAVGRERPSESPDNTHVFKPFSGHASFPSGHASTAFAAAVALDLETSSRWVPYVVYPAATAVAWSRVHDDKHWTSDVVAGAALGGWSSWKTETFLAHRALGVPSKAGQTSKRTSWMLAPVGDGIGIVMVRPLD